MLERILKRSSPWLNFQSLMNLYLCPFLAFLAQQFERMSKMHRRVARVEFQNVSPEILNGK